jgi:hypothetical protein
MRLETFCLENSWMVMWDCRERERERERERVKVGNRNLLILSSDEIRDILFRK